MDASLRTELNDCIRELTRIANALDEAANEVSRSITGMNTNKYTNSIYSSATKYRNAANSLKKIK